MAKEDNMIKRQKEYSKSKIEYGKKIVDEMINNKLVGAFAEDY